LARSAEVGSAHDMSIIPRSIPVLAVTAVLGLSAAPALAGSNHGGGHGGAGPGRHHSHGQRTCGLDRVWIKHVAQADLAEIATGNLAQQNGTSDGVKALGAMLVTDHTKHLQQVQQLAGRVNAKVPTAPAPWQQWQAGVLATFTGATFDQQWAAAQVADHLTNIDETQDEIADGCSRAVRALASATLPVLQMHLAEAQKLAGAGTGTTDPGTGTGTTDPGTGTTDPGTGTTDPGTGTTDPGTTTGTGSTSGDSSPCHHHHGGDDGDDDGGGRGV
jgi:predicted outer membrane protein